MAPADITVNVPDPSDWDNTSLPDLKELDSLQRCYICKEFLRAPVMTGCNHTFCSHCIREYLIVNSHCPLCKAEQFESNLKRVILLEEIVLCYSKIRPVLLELLMARDEINSSNEKDKSAQLKDGVDYNKDTLDSDVIDVTPQMLINESAPVRGQELASGKETKTEAFKALPERDEIVECPVCSEFMSADELQTSHIDSCLDSKGSTYKSKIKDNASHINKKRRHNSGFSKIYSFFKPMDAEQSPKTSRSSDIRITKPNLDFYFKESSKHHHHELKRLPKLDFSSLTTQKLKDKLTALNLLTTGNRNQLELRYNQYYILHNSNLDSNHPAPDKILRQRLNQWEFSHLAFSPHQNTSLFACNSQSVKNITDKAFSPKVWLRQNRTEYKDLIKQARATISKKTNGAQNQTNSPTDAVCHLSALRLNCKTSATNVASDFSLEETSGVGRLTAALQPSGDDIHETKAIDKDKDPMALSFSEDIANSSLFFPQHDL